VGAGVAQAEQCAWVLQHLAHDVEVAAVVVEDGEVDEVATVAFRKVVVQRFQRGAAALPGAHQEALHHVGFVVGRQALGRSVHREHAAG
jgi:hypothetical protein